MVLRERREASGSAKVCPRRAGSGCFRPQTGVDTPIGAPKLELLSQAIWERAQRLGVDLMKPRDDVALGRGHAVLPFMVGGGSVLGALAAP